MHMQVIESTMFCKFSLSLFIILLLHKLHFLQFIQFVDCIWLKAISNKNMSLWSNISETRSVHNTAYACLKKFPVSCLVAFLLGISNMQSDLQHKNEVHSCPSTCSYLYLLHYCLSINYTKSHLHRTGVKSTNFNSLCK
jgi:hypothetical protein